MAVKSIIRCSCGQRIVAKDVMQTGYYLRLAGPSFVYVKFRCPRCKKLGERLLRREEWEKVVLKEYPQELSKAEKKQFERLGPISVDEVIEAHFTMEKDLNLKDLSAGVEVNAVGDGEEKS